MAYLKILLILVLMTLNRIYSQEDRIFFSNDIPAPEMSVSNPDLLYQYIIHSKAAGNYYLALEAASQYLILFSLEKDYQKVRMIIPVLYARIGQTARAVKFLNSNVEKGIINNGKEFIIQKTKLFIIAGDFKEVKIMREMNPEPEIGLFLVYKYVEDGSYRKARKILESLHMESGTKMLMADALTRYSKPLLGPGLP